MNQVIWTTTLEDGRRAPGQIFCMIEKGRSDVQTVKMRNLEGLNKTHKGKKLTWNDAAEESFQRIKRELCEASLLGIPTENGRYVLDTDASVVAIFWIHHQEQEYNEKAVLRSIAYGSIVLSIKEIKYGALKAEKFAVVIIVKKYRAHLGSCNLGGEPCGQWAYLGSEPSYGWITEHCRCWKCTQ